MRRIGTSAVAVLTAAVLSASLFAGRREKSRGRAGIDAAGRGVVEAFRDRNARGLMSFYADHFMSSTVPSRDDLARKMTATFARYYDIRLTRTRVGSLHVCAPYAREVVDEILVAEAADPPERLGITGRKLIAYEKCGNRWLITGEEKIDIERERKIRGRAYDDPEKGFRIEAPQDWSLRVIGTPLMSLLVITSPDMRSSLSVGRTRVPARTSARQLLEEDVAAMMKLAGTKNVKESKIMLSGLKGHQITSDVDLAGRTARLRRAYFFDGKTLLFVIAGAESASAFEVAENDFENILNSLRLTKPRRDPALGTVEAGVYRNKKYNCAFNLPEGWEADVEKGSGEFKVSFASADGMVEGTFVCLRTRKKVSAELLVMTDEYQTSRVGVDYELLRHGVVDCADAEGYGTLSRFELAGRSCVRRRAYFCSGPLVYCLVVNIRPAGKYSEKSHDIGSLVRSIKIGVGS